MTVTRMPIVDIAELADDSPCAAHGEKTLVVRGLSKQYRSRRSTIPAFENVDLQLTRGEIVCLLGPSGCGKSSLVMAIAGLQDSDRGDVLLDGRKLKTPDSAIAVVFQEPSLLPWLNLQGNIGLGLRFKRAKPLSRTEVRRRVAIAVQAVGLAGREDAYPAELSGGMAQRVALARAIVRSPEVLLLDEPFSALDAVTRSQMQQLLRDVVAEHRTATLLVTHDVDEALTLGDRILLMGRAPGRLQHEWCIPRQGRQSRAKNDGMRREILAALMRENSNGDSRNQFERDPLSGDSPR